MKNNKGYSLVELLCALAVFAIVMLSIISLMRTASVTFKNENYEVKVEKDSQILMSQIEDMLVDSTSVVKNYGDSSNPDADKMYSFTDESGTHAIKYNGSTGVLEYYENSSSASTEILAEGIDKFSITGLTSDDSLKDNKCEINVTMTLDSKGYTSDTSDGIDYSYTGNKTVTFRNNIDGEDLGLPDLTLVVGGGGSNGEKQLDVGRYQVVNLKQLYDIDTIVSYTANGTNGYMFCDPSKVNATNKGLDSVVELTSGTSTYITTNSVCNTSGSSAYSAKVVGTTSTGSTVTVNLTTKKVGMLKGAGFVEMPSGNINNTTGAGGGGFYSYVELEGICLNDYVKYHSGDTGYVAPTGSIEVIANGTSKGSLSGNVGSVANQNNTTYSGQVNNLGISGLDRIENVGLCYDVNSPNYLIIKYHNCNTPSNGSVLTNNKLEYKIKISTPQGDLSETYRVYSCGSTMSGLN